MNALRRGNSNDERYGIAYDVLGGKGGCVGRSAHQTNGTTFYVGGYQDTRQRQVLVFGKNWDEY